MIHNLIYVYCLANSPPELDASTESRELKSFKYDGFYVVVKLVSEDEYDEENFKRNLSNIHWVETNARTHISVINSIMEHQTVIPFKFGTIFQTEERIQKCLLEYSDSLHENFKYIHAKEEWSVKVYCDRKALCSQIDELSEETAALETQIMASAPGKAFLLKRKKTEMIENEMDRLCKEYGQTYYEHFNSLSEANSLINMLPKEFTGRQDTMILNATFLVRKNKVAELLNAIEVMKGNDEQSSFFIEASGPWPPFSFISIKEKY